MPARELAQMSTIDCKRCCGLGMVLDVRPTVDATRPNHEFVLEHFWADCPECNADTDEEDDVEP